MKKRKILCLLPALTLLVGCGKSTPKKEEHVHTYVAHEAKSKTCVEDGNLFYYSCDCGMIFDENKNATTMQDIIIPFSHELTKIEGSSGFETASLDHYQCSECHKYFMDDEGALEVEEGEWIVVGDAVHYAKGEIMTTRKINYVSLASLEGKALAFDFRMVEDGTNTLCLGQSDATYNISGVFSITKSGNTYSSKGCVIEDCPTREGYKTFKMNTTLFTGDGVKLWGADGIDRIFGGWDHAAGRSDKANSEIFIDGQSFRAVDAYSHKELGRVYSFGDDVDRRIGYTITKEELTGKALSFDVFFGATGKQTIKFSLYKNGWSQVFIPDFFITHNGSEYELRQYSPTYPLLPIEATELGDGWVNIVVNASSLGSQSDYGDTCVVWKDPTTANNGVDINSFEVVDKLDVPNEILFENGNFKTFGFAIDAKELIRYGAISFKVKPFASKAVSVSFMVNGKEWYNYGTSKFITDANANLTITQSIDSSSKGNVTKLDDGWFKVIFNEYDLCGDCRSDADVQICDHLYVTGGSIIFDGDSFEYCEPYVDAGVTFASNTPFHVASWDNVSNYSGHNFSFPKSKLSLPEAGISYNFKPVGDGEITMTLMGDNWENISGNYTITKSSNSVTTNYAGAKIITRNDGWYSIYLPSPWNGDGYSKSWTSFAMVDSAGYTGTSFEMNFDSIHLYNTSYMPE